MITKVSPSQLDCVGCGDLSNAQSMGMLDLGEASSVGQSFHSNHPRAGAGLPSRGTVGNLVRERKEGERREGRGPGSRGAGGGYCPCRGVVWEWLSAQGSVYGQVTWAGPGEGGHWWAASLIPVGLLGHMRGKGDPSTCDARRLGKLQSLGFVLAAQLRTQDRGHVPDPDPAVPPAEGWETQRSPLGAGAEHLAQES